MLLETLWRQVGCLYLSDLRTEPYNRLARLAAQTLRAGDFAVQEWNDAAEYLLGRGAGGYLSAEAAQRALILK